METISARFFNIYMIMNESSQLSLLNEKHEYMFIYLGIFILCETRRNETAMWKYYVIPFTEQEFRNGSYLDLYDSFGEAKKELMAPDINAGLVYSLLSSRISDEARRRFGNSFGFYFVIDSIFDKLKDEVKKNFNSAVIIPELDIPKEAFCRYRYCS